jgi:hypothetical protein
VIQTAGKSVFVVGVKMDVAEQVARTNQVKDQTGERCQKLFQDFLEEYVNLLRMSCLFSVVFTLFIFVWTSSGPLLSQLYRHEIILSMSSP